MAMFKAHFVIGVLVGVALAIAAPLLGTELFATLSAPASANSAGTSDATIQQTVNRADKSDRLKPSHDAIGSSRPKSLTIPRGCDPAFSPLSRGRPADFSGKCFA